MGRKEAILAVLKKHEQNMEGYCYFSANMGVSEDDYDDVAADILVALGLIDAD